MKIEENISLKAYNSWKVGGEADYFCLPTHLEDMIEAQDFAAKNNLPITVIGSGSNVLISDDGIRGLVVCTKKFKGIEVSNKDGRLHISAMAGEAKFILMKAFLKENLPPAIFLSGLPGDIGGGIVMNAGIAEAIHPREFVDICDWVEVLRQGKILRFNKEDLDWSYRHCEKWRPGIIVRANFSWPLSDADKDMKEKTKVFAKTRWDRQPLDLPSCGSTFVNPAKDKSAGYLIEQAGLKGYQIGQAAVSEKHANFIVNLGEAKATDIKNLIEHIVTTVEAKFGVRLKTEVQYL